MHARSVCAIATLLLAASHALADCTLINADQQKIEQLTIQEWSLNGAFSATKADGQLLVMPTRTIFMIRQASPATQSPGTGSTLWTLLLRQGDTLVGRPRTLKENSLEFDCSTLGVVEVPLKMAASLTRQTNENPTQPQAAARDTLQLKNGDKVEGLLAAIDEKNLQMQSDLGLTTIELERIDRIVFAGVPTPPPEQISARIGFADGSQLTTQKLSWLLNEVTFHDPAGTQRKISSNLITGVDILGGAACSLTDLTPVENLQQPYLGPVRLALMNHNSVGGPLVINGATYERGIGMQAASKLVFQISGAFKTFSFKVGMDDSAAPLGLANVSVWADGREIFRKDHLQAKAPLTESTLNINDVNVLELRTEYVKDLDVQARVNWINPVLRKP